MGTRTCARNVCVCVCEIHTSRHVQTVPGCKNFKEEEISQNALDIGGLSLSHNAA